MKVKELVIFSFLIAILFVGQVALAAIPNVEIVSLLVVIVSEDFDSVGGFVFGLLDHLPSQGEELTTDNGIYFKVISMDKNRVDKLYLRIPVDFYSTSA